MEKEKTVKDFPTGELVNELIARGAVMESTHVYGGYRLTKKYFFWIEEKMKQKYTQKF